MQSAETIPITSLNITRLIQEANTMKNLLESSHQAYNDHSTQFFFLISSEWLAKWREYTSYEDVIKGYLPDLRYFGQVHPGVINIDIVEEDKPNFVKYPDDEDYRNVFLKPKLQYGSDYELLTEEAWSYLAERYESIPIKRFVYKLPNGKKYVEIALKKV